MNRWPHYQSERTGLPSGFSPGLGGDKAALAAEVIAEHFGETPGAVARRLILHGPARLPELMQDAAKGVPSIPGTPPVSQKEVHRAIILLLTHGAIGYAPAPRAKNEAPNSQAWYFAIPDMMLSRLSFASFVSIAQLRYRDEGKHLVETLLRHGRLREHELLRLAVKLSPYNQLTLEQQTQKQRTLAERLSDLIKHHLVELTPYDPLYVDPADSAEPGKKRAGDPVGEPPAKRQTG
eukprot:Hpha_TRINITY_DN1704_c0_g2::TRINITY_DN1704_c0_g2_i1::g.158507::m.158507/K03023/RPC3, POLR3C; DNA-directed RNA polymerase III subunit RPC3